MNSRHRLHMKQVITFLALFLSGSSTQGCANMEPQTCADSPLLDEVRTQGSLRVIVHLAGDFQSEDELGEEEVLAQRQRILRLQDRLLEDLAGTDVQVIRRFTSLPLVVLLVGEDALCLLLTSDQVDGVEKDERDFPSGEASGHPI